MEPDELEANPEVNYVLVIRKGPILLAGMVIFGWIALQCWNEWTKLVDTSTEEEK